jgi:hypothetical protein
MTNEARPADILLISLLNDIISTYKIHRIQLMVFMNAEFGRKHTNPPLWRAVPECLKGLTEAKKIRGLGYLACRPRIETISSKT